MDPFGLTQSRRRLGILASRAASLGLLHEEMDYDSTEDRLVVRTTQDVEPILDHNVALQNDPGYDGYSKSRDFRHVASIPTILVHHWERTEGLNIYRQEDWEYIKKKKLNDPEYRKLRTSLGRV